MCSLTIECALLLQSVLLYHADKRVEFSPPASPYPPLSIRYELSALGPSLAYIHTCIQTESSVWSALCPSLAHIHTSVQFESSARSALNPKPALVWHAHIQTYIHTCIRQGPPGRSEGASYIGYDFRAGRERVRSPGCHGGRGARGCCTTRQRDQPVCARRPRGS
jgi:hypothetical protein